MTWRTGRRKPPEMSLGGLTPPRSPERKIPMPSFVTPRLVSRRAFLRGAGVALSLPWLDAMTPAFARAEKPADAPRRVVAVQTNMGILPQHFFPKEAGADYAPTPYLELLKDHRKR